MANIICDTRSPGKHIPLNLIYDYPVKWSKYKVLRDFLQNFFDAVGYEEWQNRFSYELKKDVLTFRVADIQFSYDWLVHIGASTKRQETGKYAGYFGEGFKIASLCALRDFEWNIEMASRNWELLVGTDKLKIDGNELTSLSYRVWETRDIRPDTILCIYPFFQSDVSTLQTVFLSFYYSENPLFGAKIWSSRTAAVYFRSDRSKPADYPTTYEQRGSGIIFACYQALGSFKYPLIFCLNNFRLNDRERSGLYMMDVITIITQTVSLLPPEPAAAVLEVIKDQWYAYPEGKYDFETWHHIVRQLARTISQSDSQLTAWKQKYPELIVTPFVKKSDLHKFNRRRQALAWIKSSGIKYQLVQDAFIAFNYPVLEDLCDEYDGFTVARAPTENEAIYINLLETLILTLMADIFGSVDLPACKTIQGNRAVWQGMASCIRLNKPIHTRAGLKIRYRLPYIAIKSRLLKKGLFGEALSTYLHEMAHMFGGDESSAFSNALSVIMAIITDKNDQIGHFQKQWERME